MKSTYKRFFKYILLFICIMFLFITACNKKTEDTLLTINNQHIESDEIMLYLLQVKLEFEQLGGEDVWEHNDFSGGKKAEDVAKQGVLENIIKTKILVEKSAEMGIYLTEEEEGELKNQALKYINQLDDSDVEAYGLNEKIVIDSFKEFLLSTKVMEEATKEYTPEQEKIEQMLMENNDYVKFKEQQPEEVLKQYKVKHLLIKTHEKNEKNEYVLISDDILNTAKDKAEEALARAKAGENFDQLIKEYSQAEDLDESNGEHSLSASILTGELAIINDLRPGEISEVLKTNQGYHIVKLIDIYEPSKEEIEDYKTAFKNWEETLKNDYKKSLKLEAFNEIYKEWRNNSSIQVNEKQWEQIDIFGKVKK